MTRVLEFSGPRAPKRFQLLWASLMAGGDGKGERTPATIRKEARLQTLLEDASESVNGDGANRTLRDSCEVSLSQEDFDLLQQVQREDPVESAGVEGRRRPVGLAFDRGKEGLTWKNWN